MSEEESELALVVVSESKGADNEERERRGATSSGGPRARLGYTRLGAYHADRVWKTYPDG